MNIAGTTKGTCRSCGAAILWAMNVKTGNPMPLNLDPHPRPDANIVVDETGVAFAVAAGHGHYVSHFATCPDAATEAQMTNKILGCVPTGTPGYQPGTGYQVRKCDFCGGSCWAGPGQLKMRTELRSMLLCIPCAVRHGAAKDNVEVLDRAANAVYREPGRDE